ncbi:LOW QUALITY PROTEIN: coilin [Salvelinus sp. IW2-2015]|uniref:LOW QUALITY PROTEIN: coilin n=1 Tax=Salvelinus sp. IW2-2015 TaxID=2691554 RepID=UPI0038D4CEAE
MAASNTNVIRVRLYFDYPPPSVSDCRMCWVLVDLNKCRVVGSHFMQRNLGGKSSTSVARSIFGRLFIEDCYLPSTEAFYVVRDNDRSGAVKVDTLTRSNGSQSNTSVVNAKKKRRRDAEEEEPTQNRVSEEWKKKKKRKKEESQEADSNQAAVEERRKEDKKKQKKKDKKVATKTTASSTGPPPTSSTGPPPTSSTGPSPTVVKADKNTKKAPVATAVSVNGKATAVSVNGKATAKTPTGETDNSSDSSESSSEEEAPSKTLMQKLPPKSHSASSTPPVTSKAPPVVKPPAPVKKPRPPPSSSDSDSSDSSGDDASNASSPVEPGKFDLVYQNADGSESVEYAVSRGSRVTERWDSLLEPSKATTGKLPLKTKLPLFKPAATPPTTIPQRSGAGPRDKTTPSKPRPSLPSSGPRTSVSPGQRANGPGPGSTPSGRRPTGGLRAQALVVVVYFNYEVGQRQQTHQQPPSYQNDSLINSSVVLQNQSESVPKRDYSEMPLLAAPPQDGQKIAFKR